MKVIIVGNSDFARLIYSYVQNDDRYDVLGFTVEEDYINERFIFDLPVISYENIENKYPANSVKLLLAVGYNKMNKIKEKLYNLYKSKGYDFVNYIHNTAIVSSNVELSEANILLEGVIIENQCSIGNGNVFFAGALMGHNSKIGNFNSFSVRAVTAGYVTIENNCFLGANCTIKDKITINSSALIGAASYVSKNVSENSVIVPAKSIVLENKKSTDYY